MEGYKKVKFKTRDDCPFHSVDEYDCMETCSLKNPSLCCQIEEGWDNDVDCPFNKHSKIVVSRGD